MTMIPATTMTSPTTQTAPEHEYDWGRLVGGRRLRGARTRILASVLGLLVFSTAASLFVDRELLLDRVGERVDDTLTQEVRELQRLVEDGRNPITGRPFGTDTRAIFKVFLQRNVPGQGEEFFTFVGGRPFRSTDPDGLGRELLAELPGLANVRDARRANVAVRGGDLRYLAVPISIGGRQRGVFVVTAAVTREEQEVTEALRITSIVSVAVLVLASGIAFLVAGRVLSPVRQLTETARAISESDLTRRIPVEGSDELAVLAATFNAMLDRLEDAFATQKDFVGDAGHELRTPITVIRGHLELLGDSPGEREEIVELVCDELDRMGRLVDELLLLAKAQRPDFLRLEYVDLDVLTDELMAKAKALADRQWELEAVGTGRLTADRQRLTQAMMNLARNAAEHTSTGDRIGLGSSLDDGHARLWVSDSGPGVPAADRARIFERFARGRGRRPASDGAGLGLAIVKAVAEAHGGRVTLESKPGEGATFAVIMPTEPPGKKGPAWSAS
jgi:two-component system, OmpR family, sensor kinase